MCFDSICFPPRVFFCFLKYVLCREHRHHKPVKQYTSLSFAVLLFYALARAAWALWFFGKEGLGRRWKTGLWHMDVSPAEPWPLEMPGFPLCTKIPSRFRQHRWRLNWKLRSAHIACAHSKNIKQRPTFQLIPWKLTKWVFLINKIQMYLHACV